MDDYKLNSIKSRLKELESEKKKLLIDLALLQNDQTVKETVYLPIGHRAAPSVPVTPSEKVNLFLKLFACRTDVFPKYWQNKKTGKKGFSPVCSNEWERGVCDKPKIKCTNCTKKAFRSLDQKSLSEHLTGKMTIGTYTIRTDDSCKFLATDFDGDHWEQDVFLFKQEAEKLGVDVIVERSRSGNGGHAWIFFSEFIPALLARQLGSIIMTKAIMKSPRFDLSSYDRFFPNQDYMPKGGFGNLIALPLQKRPRENGNSVFINSSLEIIKNQWEHLSLVRVLSHLDVSKLIDQVSLSINKSDIAFEDENQSWSESSLNTLTEQIKDQCFGYKVEALVSSQLYINIEGMPSKLVAALKRLATFANPDFFKRQKMRFSTWGTPKYIFCGSSEGNNLLLPSGLIERVKETCGDAGAELKLIDQRVKHQKFRVSFKGKLKKEQKRAVEEAIQHEYGVLVAPPGSGKTVMGCAILSKRKVPTLILVHRAPLLEQWKDRIAEFVKFDVKRIGTVNGQKKKPQGKIDVAMMQTINKMKEKDLEDFLDKYEQIIVDECHHIAAFTFEAILKKSPARYILGLTATPYRKDGHQSIIHMQSGPVRYEMTSQDSEFESKRVIVRNSNFKMPEEAGPQPPIHQVWSHLITDEERLELVANDIIDNLDEARVPLVISERKEHLQLLRNNLLGQEVPESYLFILNGDLSKKQRGNRLEEIHSSIANKKPVCILTTGSLIGEGFDLPILDTLFLAMPVSYRGKIIQYAGRIHRPVEGKDEVRIYDYVDPWSGLTLSMFRKRVKAYRSMGYRIESPLTTNVYGDQSQISLFQ